MFGYAARNAMLPSVSGFALSLGFIVGGTLLVEIVFSYPGIGYLLFTRGRREGLPADAGHLPGHHARGAGREHRWPTSSTWCSTRAPAGGLT